MRVWRDHLWADNFIHIGLFGPVNHVEAIHDQRLHLLLAAGIRIPDIRGNGMVNTSDFLPIGYLSGIDLPHLVCSQVLDGILGIDDEDQRIDGQRSHHQFFAQFRGGGLLIPRDIPARSERRFCAEKIRLDDVRRAAHPVQFPLIWHSEQFVCNQITDRPGACGAIR